MINKIKGGIASDERGHIRFVNDFDMSVVKRFYIIRNGDEKLVRGWRAHRIEQRWFYAISGTFIIDVVKIDNWENCSRDLHVERHTLCAKDHELLHVPVGYGTAFTSIGKDAELLTFADFNIENARLDDYTWPVDFFINRVE